MTETETELALGYAKSLCEFCWKKVSPTGDSF
jgi:hypothetical protein